MHIPKNEVILLRHAMYCIFCDSKSSRQVDKKYTTISNDASPKGIHFNQPLSFFGLPGILVHELLLVV